MNPMTVKDILANTASVCTILQFLSGLLVCRKFIKNKSVGDASGLAFVTGFISCSLWMIYGMLINDKSITVVNIFGSSLQFFYAFTFYIYTVKKNVIVKQMLVALTFISFMYLYWFASSDVDSVARLVGFISCAFTIAFFASPLVSLVSWSVMYCFNLVQLQSLKSIPHFITMAVAIEMIVLDLKHY
ncbi:hypothetical protein QAD02_019055 [Eretmocerus hayati]|uniref:Uncharacterized protein n=1 Tax=Eretmocerus hayati TaxID=131215 RepID=A0ACC2PJN9_9HYME|nr:hypothetical protein QAD02_019055 [Eretmocerus hayati]